MELTKFVKQLLLINIGLFLVTLLLKLNFLVDLVLFPINSDRFQIHQLLSYMFLHSSITHIVFNMIGLVVFGPELENLFGSNKFFNFSLLKTKSKLFFITYTDGFEFKFKESYIIS
mgnify:CR=1 FL=1